MPYVYYSALCDLHEIEAVDQEDGRGYYEFAFYFFMDHDVAVDAFSVESIKRKIFEFCPATLNEIDYSTIIVCDSSTTETKLSLAVALSSYNARRDYIMRWTAPHHMASYSGRVDSMVEQIFVEVPKNSQKCI